MKWAKNECLKNCRCQGLILKSPAQASLVTYEKPHQPSGQFTNDLKTSKMFRYTIIDNAARRQQCGGRNAWKTDIKCRINILLQRSQEQTEFLGPSSHFHSPLDDARSDSLSTPYLTSRSIFWLILTPKLSLLKLIDKQK